MAKMVKIIKKKDEYSMEYEVGDVLKVDSTWYGGVTVLGKTGVPVSIDKDEYEEVKDILSRRMLNLRALRKDSDLRDRAFQQKPLTI